MMGESKRLKTNTIKSFTELGAWQVAHSLRISILKEIKKFPDEYKYGLSGQLQRTAISVGSNIAEGFGRRTIKDKRRFYDIARGSLTELQDQLIVSKDMGLVSSETFKKLALKSVSAHRLIFGLIRSLDKKAKPEYISPSRPIPNTSSQIPNTAPLPYAKGTHENK